MNTCTIQTDIGVGFKNFKLTTECVKNLDNIRSEMNETLKLWDDYKKENK